MKNPLKLLLGFSSLMLVGFTACGGTRAEYETARYKTAVTDGRFEIREYPAMRVVEAEASAEGSNGSFRKLFRFISGRNDASAKIAMTTPVFLSGSAEKRTMSFVMPEALEAKGVPKPLEEGVSLRMTSAGEFAVARFSGARDSARESKALADLRVWLNQEGYTEKGDPVFAYFDPPWTPAFLRRNEVMLGIEAR